MQQVFNRFIEKFHYFSWLATFTSRSLAHKFCHMKFLKVLPSFSKFAHKTRAERPFVLVSGASDARKSGLTYILPFKGAEHKFQLRFRLRFDSDSDSGTPVLPYFMAVLYWLPSARKRAECRVPSAECRETEFYANILIKFTFWSSTVLSESFTYAAEPDANSGAAWDACCRRSPTPVLPRRPCRCQSCRPFLIYFHLKNQVQSAKTGKKKATGVGSGSVAVPVSASASASVSISLSSPHSILAVRILCVRPVERLPCFDLGLGLGCNCYRVVWAAGNILIRPGGGSSSIFSLITAPSPQRRAAGGGQGKT